MTVTAPAVLVFLPAGICHAGRGEAPAARGFDVNRAPSSVAASGLAALEDDEEDPGAAAALSSSPNDDSAGSFPLDLGGPRAHAKGGAAAQAGGGGERSSSRASDEDEGASTRKKLRLSKEQSAFLEESFKEHSTLNPVRIHGNLLIDLTFVRTLMVLTLSETN